MIDQHAERAADWAVQVTPIRVKKLGHVVYYISDIDRSVKFWTEVLGFKVSDVNEMGMVFLRCGTDHHTIALAPKDPQARLPADDPKVLGTTHFALEVASVDELFRARDVARSLGLTVASEGRRGPGSNLEVHILDPDGYDIELYADMDQVEWDGQARPAEQWRRAPSLEEAVANPVPDK